VIGFYQVIAGIFFILARVQWPVALISMETYLKMFEGNIFQLSCIYLQLPMNQFSKFILVLLANAVILSFIFLYLFLKKRYIQRKMDCFDSKKQRQVSCLKKSCYQNIFFFLLASYPITSRTIISQILPFPGACVT